MGSINPFSQYLIREMRDSASDKTATSEKVWHLEESIFRKPQGAAPTKKENLIRTSSEMFVIYKFTNDPYMRVKSDKYTNGRFVQVRDLFPREESALFETSLLEHLKMMQESMA